MESEAIISPLLGNRPIYVDENTTEMKMRSTSVREMIKLAEKPDPKGRNLMFEELNRAKPSEDVLEALLAGDPTRISKTDSAKHSPLHIACNHIHSIDPDILLFLMEKDPETIQKPNKHGWLPLHKAVACSLCHNRPPNVDNINILLEAYPEAVRKKTKKLQFPLHLAISEPSRRMSSEVVELILNAEPKVCKKQDSYGHTPLHKVVRRKGPEAQMAFDMLIEAYPGAAKLEDQRGMLPLHHAVCPIAPHIETIYELVEAYPQGVLHRDKTHDMSIVTDHQGRYPMDIILTKGDDRCGTTMDVLNTTYEKLKFGQVRSKVREKAVPSGEEMDGPVQAGTVSTGLRSGSQASEWPGTTDSDV